MAFEMSLLRADLSNHLIHLTRGEIAEANFRQIVRDRALLGSSKGIRGGFKVICFSEAPVDVLARIFSGPPEEWRYSPFGVMVPKSWLFGHGGRPVIYQPEDEFQLLPESLQYRHVRYDQPGGEKDFTFEREWRIRAGCN
jgi:hypothetical protein